MASQVARSQPPLPPGRPNRRTLPPESYGPSVRSRDGLTRALVASCHYGLHSLSLDSRAAIVLALWRACVDERPVCVLVMAWGRWCFAKGVSR